VTISDAWAIAPILIRPIGDPSAAGSRGPARQPAVTDLLGAAGPVVEAPRVAGDPGVLSAPLIISERPVVNKWAPRRELVSAPLTIGERPVDNQWAPR
jgi:hypothetical protein